MHTTITLCSALLGALVLLLAFWTSIVRGQSKEIAYGATKDPESRMFKAERAHGNSAEYAGVLIGLFILTGLVNTGRDLGLAMTSLVIAITAARYIHALGFLTCKTLAKPHPFKAIGALVTYLGGLALCMMLVVQAL